MGTPRIDCKILKVKQKIWVLTTHSYHCARGLPHLCVMVEGEGLPVHICILKPEVGVTCGSQSSPPPFLKQGLSAVHQLVKDPPPSSCLHVPCAGMTGCMLPSPVFLIYGDSNSIHQAYAAGTFPMEPSPQPCFILSYL